VNNLIFVPFSVLHSIQTGGVCRSWRYVPRVRTAHTDFSRLRGYPRHRSFPLNMPPTTLPDTYYGRECLHSSGIRLLTSSSLDPLRWHRPDLYARGTRAGIQPPCIFGTRLSTAGPGIVCFPTVLPSIYVGLQAPLDSSFLLSCMQHAVHSLVNAVPGILLRFHY
jgi:hypothetical protein